MTQTCKQCGKSLEPNATSCPYCHGNPGSQPTSLVDPSVDRSSSQKKGNHVHVVTAPVRKKRTLPMSCLMGILIFAPTIFLVAFLLHFYSKQNRLREEQDFNRDPVAEMKNNQKLLAKLGEAMGQLVLNAQPELIEAMNADSTEQLTITVKPQWNSLSKESQTSLHDRWLSKWQRLDGTRIKLVVAEDNQPSDEGP